MNKFNDSAWIIGLIVIILIGSIGVINYLGISVPYFSLIEKGVFNILSPLFSRVAGFYHSLVSYWDGLLNTGEIVAENNRLKEKVADLRRRNLNLQKMGRQNLRLRKLLSFKEFIPYKTKGAEVIGHGPSNWEDKILINRGQKDGIEEKMPVISYNGTLVGRIDYVGANSAQVKLVNDPDFVIGGIVQREESRAIGLIRGQTDKENINIMEKIAWDADIKKGDIILTSGLSNNYPKDLPIGQVTEVKSDNYGISQSAVIELYFSRYTIEEVLVVTEF